MSFISNVRKLIKEAKKRIKNNSKKRSFFKSIKRAAITLVAMGIVTGIAIVLGKAGIDLEPEQKSELITFIVELILGGATLSFATFFGLDMAKKRYNE